MKRLFNNRPAGLRRTVFAGLTALLILAAPAAQAQGVQPAAAEAPPAVVTLTLEDAIQIARLQNYALRNLQLNVENAEAQVKEAWGTVLPQVELSSSYTRNIVSANPFAGSSAGGLFQSLGFVDWLAYNERARTDTDAGTQPIPFGEFIDRQEQGLEAAGIALEQGSNPFGVDNQFTTGIAVEQTLFNQSAFAAIRGAEALMNINARAADRQEQLLIGQVREAFYGALLAQEQAGVTQQSVARTLQTVQEVGKQVAQGVTPKFQRLSAEVELANLETQFVQVENQASLALDDLKLVLGIPIEQPITLRGELEAENLNEFLTVSVDDAVDAALENRPDLEQARLAIELRQIDKDITQAQYFPSVTAFLGFNYMGNVPDNRSFTIADPDDPFQFTRGQSGFFSNNYWNPSLNGGIRLSWNLFNGFQTSARVQQRQIAVDQAQNDAEQLLQTVTLDVERAIKNLQAARQRIGAQEQNIQRAELNYEYAQARLTEGVATQLEEREASEQLDQSRLNYLQAVYDYLVAESAFETAVGRPLPERGTFRLTSN
jgi:outer membrane protein TolC